MIDAMEKEIRNPTFAFSLLFLSPSLSFASSKPLSCSPLSSLPSGTGKVSFIASNPRFHLQISVSETPCFWNVPTRPVQGLTRVVCLCVCEVESPVVSAVEQRLMRPVQDVIRVVSKGRFFLNPARILQNKSKLAAVPHSIDISIKYDSFSSLKHRFGRKSRSDYRQVYGISCIIHSLVS